VHAAAQSVLAGQNETGRLAVKAGQPVLVTDVPLG